MVCVGLAVFDMITRLLLVSDRHVAQMRSEFVKIASEEEGNTTSMPSSPYFLSPHLPLSLSPLTPPLLAVLTSLLYVRLIFSLFLLSPLLLYRYDRNTSAAPQNILLDPRARPCCLTHLWMCFSGIHLFGLLGANFTSLPLR